MSCNNSWNDFNFLGHLNRSGIGTIMAAFTMGKVVGMIGEWLDRRFYFVSFLNNKKEES